MKFNHVIWTDGSGLWSNSVRPVTITHLEVPYISDDNDFGELRVYFDTNSWDTDQHGLIYTDKAFIEELRLVLTEILSLSPKFYYSEQGMQGDDYVSFDIERPFISSWLSKCYDNME